MLQQSSFHHESLSALMQLSGQGLAQAFFASLLEAPALLPAGAGPIDPCGDHSLNPDFATITHAGGLKPAAVLIAVDMALAEPALVLTVRTNTLSRHAGQIAFPGGRMDDGESPLEAALREACEEIALPPQSVQVQGFLPSYASRTGYRVYPVVGAVDGFPALVANPGEVDQIFCVPLRFLLDPSHAVLASRTFEGNERYFYSYPFQNHSIWGLTAGIIHHMSLRLLDHFVPQP